MTRRAKRFFIFSGGEGDVRNTPTRLPGLFKVEETAHFLFEAVLLLRGGGGLQTVRALLCTLWAVVVAVGLLNFSRGRGNG